MITYICTILILLFLMGLYFLPTILAHGKPKYDAILILNLLLGWTFIGWVVALMMALWKPEKVA